MTAPMAATQVRALVDAEIAGRWDERNGHGVDLRRCLVDPPRRETYRDGSVDDAAVTLWLVLEENPASHRGYEVVFEESCGAFGLAVRVDGAPVFIGRYGTFLDALRGM